MFHTQVLERPQLGARLALIAGFALFTGVAAQVRIPLPFTPVPVTLQVLAVILAGLLLGARDGFLSQLLYLVLVALGAPLASGGVGGPAAFAGPTAGYLLSFPIAALVVGLLAGDGARRLHSFLAALAGIAVIYLLGASWLAFTLQVGPARAVSLGVAPFLPVDIAKALMAVLAGRSGVALLRTLTPPH